tara:strand:+ start:3875 stop:4060 length:186 start_codon:yes stop_codon:yes gene_type:complete
MTTGQIILAIIIVSLSIVMPIYYQYLDKKDSKKKETKKTEAEKIKAYGENINQETRNKPSK